VTRLEELKSNFIAEWFSFCETDEAVPQLDALIAEAQRECLEKAVEFINNMPPGKPTGGGDFDEWSLDEIAEQVRALLPEVKPDSGELE